MPRLERTEFAIEEVRRHLRAVGAPSPQVENFLAQYLTVTFYAEMERKVKEIYSRRIARNADPRVSYFAEESADKWSRLVPKSDIAKLAGCFGDDCKDRFNGALNQRDVSIYSSVINSRHDASHGTGGNVTISQVEEAATAAANILDHLEAAIS